jgi:hypothetical protein
VEEYTIYPKGYRHGYGNGATGGIGEEHDYGYYDGMDRTRRRRRRRRRSTEETKGFLLAALIFVAGVVLCWD